MGAPMFGLASGGLTFASSMLSGFGQASGQKAQASSMEQQAAQMRQQAKIQRINGDQQLRAIDKKGHQLSRNYRELTGRNAVSSGVGNVDLSSGSAMQVAEGNATLYANDMGENAYNRALTEWQTAEQIKQSNYQADAYDAQASYLKKTASSIGPTLLTSALAGISTGLGAYQAAGGTFFEETSNPLINIGEENDLGFDVYIRENMLKKK